MYARIFKPLILFGLAAAGGYGLFRWEQNHSETARLQAELRRVEEQRQHLQAFVQRLSSEKRVAEIIVTDQTKTPGGGIDTSRLMFVETAPDGTRLPPRFFTIKGNVAHLDALVIKFDRDFVEQNDALRGHSLVLFYRFYGDYQMPAEGFRIDDPDKAPLVYQVPGEKSPELASFVADLWKDFWRLADDEKYREEKGVRVAQGEGPWTYFHPDRVYSITLESAGGLNIVSRPMDELYREYVRAVKAKP